MDLSEELKKQDIEASTDENLRERYSHDTSIFEVKPTAVVFPKNSEEIQKLIQFVSKNKKEYPNLSLTARAAGTDMTGGPLTDSLVIDVTKYLNRIHEITREYAIVETGVYFRDFEKEIEKRDEFYPPYPASKELCAMGGIVANNSGGEKTLKYGKTNKYILGLCIILSDGKEYYLEKLDKAKLAKKMSQKNFEGEVYSKMHKLITKNIDLIKKSRPIVSKNSSGYNIWDIFDGEYFDLTQLICGSQGTLGIITEAKLKLVPKPKHEKLYVVFIKNLDALPEFTKEVLALKPTSLEVTDDHTFKLYLRYAREMASLLGKDDIFSTIKLFLPEALLIARFGIPKLVLLAEFEGDDPEVIHKQIINLEEIVKKYNMVGRLCKTKLEANKYWRLRRDTFKLLREKIKDKHSLPFIDDLVVTVDYLPEFWPKLIEILDQHKILYTISGHLGDGNLHIIPLMDLSKAEERKKIWEVTDKVYNLVLEHHGSITGEHNDGIIRSPYLKKEFGEQVYGIFKEIKQIFDPLNIFNPHKKIDVPLEFAKEHMKRG